MSQIVKKLCKVIVFALTGVVALLLGFLLSGIFASGFLNEGDIFFFVLAVSITTYLSIILHEVGHLVFGLISGYKFSSFRIGSLMWVRQGGKIRLCRMSIAGTGGQCLMIPPEPKDGKIPVKLYNLGGVIFNLIFCAIFAILYAVTLRYIVIALVFLISTIISFIFVITNGIPLEAGGIANDGMNALHLSKDSMAALAFRNQLLMNAAQTEGVRLSDMPCEWFEIPDGADIKNVHIASIAVFAASRALDSGDLTLAEHSICSVLNSGYNIIGIHRSLLTCDLIYCRLLNGTSVDKLITPELKKFMSAMGKFPGVIRTEYTIALLVDNDISGAEKIVSKFEKQRKKFPYPQEIDAEKALMNKVLEKYNNLNKKQGRQ